MDVQVRFQRGGLGICFQTCPFSPHTLGSGGRHDMHHISRSSVCWKVLIVGGIFMNLGIGCRWIYCIKYTPLTVCVILMHFRSSHSFYFLLN